jgi:hypothetical protein
MMMDWNAYRDQVNAAVREISAANPEIVKAYGGLSHANAKSTHIDAKTRELIALAVAVTLRRLHQCSYRCRHQGGCIEGRNGRCPRCRHHGQRRCDNGLFGTHHRYLRYQNGREKVTRHPHLETRRYEGGSGAKGIVPQIATHNAPAAHGRAIRTEYVSIDEAAFSRFCRGRSCRK